MAVLNCLCGERIEAEDAQALSDAYWAHADHKHADLQLSAARRQNATEAVLRTGGWDGQRRDLGDDVVIRPLRPAMRDDYLHYFDTEALADNPAWASCYCLSYNVDYADWEDRSSAANRAEKASMIENGQATGVLAYSDNKVVGWCNASAWTSLPLLAKYPEFVPEDPDSAGGIVCFVIAPSYRGQGLAGKLLAGACDMLRERGLKWVYAYPPKASGTDAGSYHGKLPMYLAAGFEETGKGNQRYTVVRKALA
jgi:ribosomal protein S18 acetylase RimI-like enzyme